MLTKEVTKCVGFKSLKVVLGIAILGFSSFTYADNLDSDTIKKIHDQVVTSFGAKCNKEMNGATPAVCSCLAEKAQSYLDDAALSKCAFDDSGSDCIAKAVSDAASKAMAQEVVNTCIASSETIKKSEPVVMPAAPAGDAAVKTPPAADTTVTPVVVPQAQQ